MLYVYRYSSHTKRIQKVFFLFTKGSGLWRSASSILACLGKQNLNLRPKRSDQSSPCLPRGSSIFMAWSRKRRSSSQPSRGLDTDGVRMVRFLSFPRHIFVQHHSNSSRIHPHMQEWTRLEPCVKVESTQTQIVQFFIVSQASCLSAAACQSSRLSATLIAP